jgi:hypothetical protein
VTSLAIVALAFTVGIVASAVADRRDPEADAKREERGQRTSRSDAEEESAGDEAERPAESEAASRRR